jgi:precorrin-6B C5,15-methyltransferase / cobalt-precorrin-6B C5,C15-methyltransferase
MEDILAWTCKTDRSVRVVVNAVAIETASETIACFESMGFRELDITCISVSRGRSIGGKHLMQAINPIYIISGEFGGT